MPKSNNNKKGKGKGASKKVDASTADADDDLDDILAEVMAGDLQQLPFNGSNLPAITASSNASSNASPTDARARDVSIPEETINDAIRRGDTAQLKRWGRRGVRVRSVTSLLTAVGGGARNAVLKILVQDLGADVNQADENGFTCLTVAVHGCKIDAVRCLVKELGVDVNQSEHDGATALIIAARKGHLDMIRCLVKELGADVNQAMHNGCTPLMYASFHKQVSNNNFDTAVKLSRYVGAPAEQTAYLEARTHCAKPGCAGAGLKKCAGCLKVYFCSPACQVAYWPAHKAECKRIAAQTSSSSSSSSSTSVPYI
jgi:hypothetical protein